MLSIQNLSVSVENKSIIQNCSLDIKPGQIHVLMGPNGSGKSSLVYTLMGHPWYEVTAGSVSFLGNDLLELPTHKRSLAGMYLSMQHPQDIAGLQILPFLKEIYELHKGQRCATQDFLQVIRPLLESVGLDEQILHRSVNDGFSGGEKKRFELLQMMLLRPKLALLDEIDSGVDIDGLRLIAKSLQAYMQDNPDSSLVIVTHYRRILEFVCPDVVHVMSKGHIVATGNSQILDHIEQKGYESYEKRSE